MADAGDILLEAAQTFKQRNAVYSDNFIKVGKVMNVLFPDGMNLQTEEDFMRWHLFELIIIKLTRYANNFKTGGHPDSIRDAGVYCAMVEAADILAQPEDEIPY